MFCPRMENWTHCSFWNHSLISCLSFSWISSPSFSFRSFFTSTRACWYFSSFLRCQNVRILIHSETGNSASLLIRRLHALRCIRWLMILFKVNPIIQGWCLSYLGNGSSFTCSTLLSSSILMSLSWYLCGYSPGGIIPMKASSSSRIFLTWRRAMAPFQTLWILLAATATLMLAENISNRCLTSYAPQANHGSKSPRICMSSYSHKVLRAWFPSHKTATKYVIIQKSF